MKNLLKDILVLIILVLFSFFCEVYLDKYLIWDLHAYHYYNGWAFLNHRLDVDIMPAIFRSYFNPLLDSLSYLVISKFNKIPYIFFFIVSLKFSILLFLSYKIFSLVFVKDCKNRTVLVFLCLLLTIFSPICLITKEIESTDMPTACIVLLGIYLFLKTFYSDNIKKNYILIFFSSFLIGAAFGLKYTNISVCIATFLIVLFRYKSFKYPIKTLLLMILGNFCGFLLTDGFWMYTLWNKFHNPMFPYFNEIFHSPYADSDHIFNTDFQHIRPKNILQFIFYPLLGRGFEDKYFDTKILFVFFGLIATGIISLFNKNFTQKISSLIKPEVFYFLLIIAISTYYINAFIFGNNRYILPVYCLSSLFVVVICHYFACIFKEKKDKIFLALLITFTITSMCVLYSWHGFLVFPWNSELKSIIKVEDFHFEDNSIVFCATTMTSFVVPIQNKNAKYVYFAIPKKIKQNRTSVLENMHWNDFYTSSKLESTLSDIINKENGKMYAIFSELMLGEEKADMSIYQEALRYYSNNKKEFVNCKELFARTFERYDLWPGPYFVCEIK